MSANDPAGVESTDTTRTESLIGTDSKIDWDGPFAEYNAYGDRTGHTYVQCPDCGIEVLTDRREHATHRPECEHR